MKQRICAFPKCKTLLNNYNKEKFCCLHQRTIVQNDLIYVEKPFIVTKKIKIRKGFYKNDPAEIKQKSPLSIMNLIRLKGLPIELPDEPEN